MDKEYFELLNKFSKWEYHRNLFQYKIRNIEVWDFIRYDISNILLKNILKIKTNTIMTCTEAKESNQLISCYKGHNSYLFRNRDILFINMPRRQKKDNIYISPFLDGLIEKLKYTFYVLEPRKVNDRNLNIRTPNIKFFDPESLYKKSNLNKKEKLRIDRLIVLIEKDFKILLNKEDKIEIYNMIGSVVSNRKRMRMYYKLILHQIKPKVLVIVGAAFQYNKYLIELAKEMGIPTVEYSHGLNVAECALEMYFNNEIKIKTYPDYIWLYSNFTRNKLYYPIRQDKIVSVGNMYHENCIAEYKTLNENKAKKNIYIISNFYIESRLDILAQELAESINLNEYQVIFKLHPGEVDWRYKYPALLNSKVKVVGIDEKEDIYYYLRDADTIIGTMSTVMYEATSFHIKILIYNGIKGINTCLVDGGYAHLVYNIDEIKDKLSSDDYYNNIEEPIYTENPIAKVNKEISKIIKHDQGSLTLG